MQWQPGGIGPFISGYGGVILMRRSDRALEIGKDEAPYGFWMNQEIRANQHLHDMLQQRMMR